MVIQSEVVYSGYGYPQQSCVTSHQQQSWYTTDGHSNNGYGMQTKPGPYYYTNPPHTKHHTFIDSTDSPQHEGWHGQNKHHNGGYGASQYYKDGSSGQALPYNCNDTSPYPYNNNKLKNGAEKTEYHTYHESSHVPMAATVVETMKYEYPPGVLAQDPYTHGPQNGYKKVEWTVKGIDN